VAKLKKLNDLDLDNMGGGWKVKGVTKLILSAAGYVIILAGIQRLLPFDICSKSVRM
jgi:hypothetical protein